MIFKACIYDIQKGLLSKKILSKKELNLCLCFIRLYCSSLIDTVTPFIRTFICDISGSRHYLQRIYHLHPKFHLDSSHRLFALFLCLLHEEDLWRKVRLSFLTTFPSLCKDVSIVVYGTTYA